MTELLNLWNFEINTWIYLCIGNNKTTVEIAFKFIFLEISIKIITFSYRNLKKKNNYEMQNAVEAQ